MVKEGRLPFVLDTARPARVGVLPRTAQSADAIRWFETGKRQLCPFHCCFNAKCFKRTWAVH